MTSTPADPRSRPIRVVLDIALRAGALVGGTAILTSLSDGSDALAAGLGEFCTLAGLGFAIALLDALLQRDRARLHLVWTVVVPLVAALKTAAYLRLILTGPGAYASLTQLPEGEVRDSLLLWGVVVGLPVLVGVVLGTLVRPLTPSPSHLALR